MRVGVLILSLAVCASHTAFAQVDPAGDYQSLISEAVAEFDARRFEEARALFRRAHAVAPNARTLRGIGLTSFEMRDYVETWLALTESLASEDRPLTESQRAEAQELLERTRRFVGIYRLDIDAPDPTLTVNGRLPTVDGNGQLLLGLGAHTIRATSPARGPAEIGVRVQGGEDEALALTLPPIESDVAHGPEPRRTGAAPAVGRHPEIIERPTDPLPFVLLGAGAVLIIGAGLSGALWWAGRQDEIGRCDEAPAGCENLGQLETARDVAAGTTIALGALGVVGLALGLVTIARTGEDSPELACAVSPGGLGCAARF